MRNSNVFVTGKEKVGKLGDGGKRGGGHTKVSEARPPSGCLLGTSGAALDLQTSEVFQEQESSFDDIPQPQSGQVEGTLRSTPA